MNNMKYITLTQGHRAIVDNLDFEYINQFKWYYSKGYAVRGIRRKTESGGYRNIMMHRLINKTPLGFETDHVNRDKLDNRRSNLRTASNSLNQFNAGIRKDNTSGFIGVSWYKTTGKWRAVISVKGKLTGLGYFNKIEDAIKARQIAERELGLELYDVLPITES
jgi:hypothetical protein